MTKLALCVGINYKGEHQLQGCLNDMNDWANLLTGRGFEQVTVLGQEFAKRLPILDQLKYLVNKLVVGDLLVFTYSGHGTWMPDNNGDDPDGRDEALCPWDILTDGDKALIIDDELREIFDSRAKGSRILMISDSCHSGTVTRLLPPLPGAGVERSPRFISPVCFMPKDQSANPYILTPHDYQALKTLGTKAATRSVKYSALLMSGCKDNEYSYDSVFHGRPNGAFTYVALQELKKLQIGSTYLDWYKAVRKVLPSSSAPQRPMLDGRWDWKNWKIFE